MWPNLYRLHILFTSKVWAMKMGGIYNSASATEAFDSKQVKQTTWNNTPKKEKGEILSPEKQ